ncbi:MAG: carboxypeptidase M32 [Candidatus Hodarchaeota archaeon]
MNKTTEILNLYHQLCNKVKEYKILERIYEFIWFWDSNTYLPPKGYIQRGDELGALKREIKRKITHPDFENLLNQTISNESYSTLNKKQKRNINLIKRRFEMEKRFSSDLENRINKQIAKATAAWKMARDANDYSLYEPELNKLIKLHQEKARSIDASRDPLEVLMERFDYGISVDTLCYIFETLKSVLIPVVAKLPVSKSPKVFCSKDTQERILEDLADRVGHDLSAGRIDETRHPFAAGHRNDVRIAVVYDEENLLRVLFAGLHEMGHAIYEQNLNAEDIYQPIGEEAGAGFHESQSRFLENFIGRSRSFWRYYLPFLKSFSIDSIANLDSEAMYEIINRVSPSKNRIQADELTYSLHVIIRYELERDLLLGNITTSELPMVWNESYSKYLGVEIQNDNEGVLQDITWAIGGFGVFPGYVLGNCFAAQMFDKMKKDIPDFDNQVENGNLKIVISWLNENVHKQGYSYDPLELIEIITKKKFDPHYFIQYLQQKYVDLFNDL